VPVEFVFYGLNGTAFEWGEKIEGTGKYTGILGDIQDGAGNFRFTTN
jgi:hypothetical protein